MPFKNSYILNLWKKNFFLKVQVQLSSLDYNDDMGVIVSWYMLLICRMTTKQVIDNDCGVGKMTQFEMNIFVFKMKVVKKLITVIMAGMASVSQQPLLPSTKAHGQTGCRWVLFFSHISLVCENLSQFKIYWSFFLVSKLLSIGRIWVRNICRWRHLSGFLANFCQRQKKNIPQFP